MFKEQNQQKFNNLIIEKQPKLLYTSIERVLECMGQKKIVLGLK